MRRQYPSLITLATGFALLSLSGCSEQPDTLTFKPNDGDTRSYQVLADTFVEAQSQFGQQSDRIRSTMLTEYRVEEDEGWILHISPSYMRMSFRNGSFASSREPDYFDREVREIMGPGFQMHLDSEMNVTDFRFKAEQHDTATDERDVLLDIFKDEFTRPGLAHGLQLREGATRQIPADDQLPQVTLTLTEIRGEHALVTMEGANDKVKVFGLAVIDIESGWIQRATMVTDIQEEEDGTTANVRSVMSMYPADWALDMDLEYLHDTGIMALEDDIDFSALDEPATEAQALANPTGYIESSDDRLNLMYYHDSVEVNTLGHIELRDAQAFDFSGEPLALPLQLSESITYTYFYGGEQTQTRTDAYPLGWDNVYQQLTELGYIQATMDWYPQTQEVVELSVADTTTEVVVGDAKAILTPGDDEGVYILVVEQGEQVNFDYRVTGATAVGLGYKPFDGAPDWLDIGESRLLTVTEYGYHPGYYEVFFEGDRPDSIQLLAVHIADSPAASREINFYDSEAMNANPYVAPPETVSLYSSDIEREFSGFHTSPLDLKIFTTQPEGDLNIEDFDRPQAFLTLTPEQAALCELTLDNNDLVFNELPAPEGHRLPPGKLNNLVIMQLQTPDQRQQYFYDLEITVNTSCPTSYQWQRMEWEPDEHEHAWLIELEDLNGIEADMPMTKLLRRFAFLSVADTSELTDSASIRARSLALMAPVTESQDGYSVHANYHTSTVADYLYEDRFLRVAGSVGSILRLVADDEVVEQTLTHRFPSLPDLDTTFAEEAAAGGDNNE